jgi:murein DD-endopeptidase MepM/ murein hydrolase activator NlpD
MALWSAGTASYFAFRDDLLTRLIGRQAEMQYAYEDRIAELRAQVDRLTSRQLLDQDQIEQKIDQLTRRQSTLESRASALSSLPDSTPTGSIKPLGRPAARIDGAAPKPSPINDIVSPAAPAAREASLAGSASRKSAPTHGVEARLARLETALDRVEARQSVALLALEESYDSKTRRMRGVLAAVGLDPGKIAPATPRPGLGGPFVPVSGRIEQNAFDRQLQRIQMARADVERLNRTLTTVPIRVPMPGDVETSSGFGVRLDPFLRQPAMHTGLDFRAGSGEPVRATAGGKVTSTGWNGGYGRLVEIDHGNGLSTRYAHLSEILVAEDQVIRPGQIVGRVGSTGRSTGPHLHYETRVDGEAVDPQKFLRAGLRLGEKL